LINVEGSTKASQIVVTPGAEGGGVRQSITESHKGGGGESDMGQNRVTRFLNSPLIGILKIMMID
jgi:hypothetical protein